MSCLILFSSGSLSDCNSVAIEMIISLLSEPDEDCLLKPVGISNQCKIPDNQMKASSQYDTGYKPAYGRLNGDRGDGWCAKKRNRKDDWLQVDLGTTIEVCAIATQGDINGNEWVTDFKLSYSSDAQNWTPYNNANGEEMVRVNHVTSMPA